MCRAHAASSECDSPGASAAAGRGGMSGGLGGQPMAAQALCILPTCKLLVARQSENQGLCVLG